MELDVYILQWSDRMLLNQAVQWSHLLNSGVSLVNWITPTWDVIWEGIRRKFVLSLKLQNKFRPFSCNIPAYVIWRELDVRCRVLNAVTVKVAVFCDVRPCSWLQVYQTMWRHKTE
jgi:hypothetical protein